MGGGAFEMTIYGELRRIGENLKLNRNLKKKVPALALKDE